MQMFSSKIRILQGHGKQSDEIRLKAKPVARTCAYLAMNSASLNR